MRRSSHITSSVSTTPTNAMTMIGTNSFAVANTLAYSTIMPPSPLMAVKELGNDDADDRQADRQAYARHDEGDRRRQNDLPKNLPFSGAIGAADLQHPAAHVADAGIGVHGNGEDRDRDQDRHLTGEFQSCPQDDQRDESDARDGVERV